LGSSVDRKAFDAMNYATADKTAVNLMGNKAEVTSEDIHSMLMFAGFTPGLGNAADLADAILYAAEGELGKAGLSMAAVIPFIGQAVSAKRALKVAKESGEEMVRLYRGVEKWYPGKMVKEGKFVGSGKASTRMGSEGIQEMFYTASFKPRAQGYAKRGPFSAYLNDPPENLSSIVLEFEVPKSYLNKFSVAPGGKLRGTNLVNEDLGKGADIIFKDGLPKEFLTKVHK
jgi:hypothetical protein